MCLWNGTFCVPAGSTPPCWDRKQTWDPKRTQSPEAFHRCGSWLQCWNLPNHFYGNNVPQFFSDPFLLLEQQYQKLFQSVFPMVEFCFRSFSIAFHQPVHVSTCGVLACFLSVTLLWVSFGALHFFNDCLEVGINNEGYLVFILFGHFSSHWPAVYSFAGLFMPLQDSFCCNALQTPMAKVFPSSMPRLVVQQSADAFHRGKMSRIFRCGHQ